MNIFGGMGFARIIKTFVPGVFLLVSFAGYFDLLALRLRGKPMIWPWVESNQALAIAIASIAAIAVGVLSNMLVFTFATDRLIRRDFSKAHRSLEKDESNLLVASTELICGDGITLDRETSLDIEYLLSPKLPLAKITYLQESYWYYLKFQMNMGVVVTFAGPLMTLGAFRSTLWLGGNTIVATATAAVSILGILSVLWLLLKTARVNFSRHRIKRFSILLTAYNELARELGVESSIQSPRTGSRPQSTLTRQQSCHSDQDRTPLQAFVATHILKQPQHRAKPTASGNGH